MVEEWIYQVLVGPREVCALLLGLQAEFLVTIYFLPLLLFSNKGVSKGSEILHGLLTHKNIRIPLKKLVPPHNANVWRTNEGNFEKLS